MRAFELKWSMKTGAEPNHGPDSVKHAIQGDSKIGDIKEEPEIEEVTLDRPSSQDDVEAVSDACPPVVATSI